MSDEQSVASTPHERDFLLERMLFFSDAVFAIVLTLLALDLRLPAGFDDAHLLDALAAMRGEIIAFVISFGLVGTFWMAHLTMTRALLRFDWSVAVANLVFLLTVSVTPFVLTLVGADGTLGNAWRAYCVSIIAIAAAQAVLLIVSHRDEQRLIHDEHHGRLIFRLIRASSPGVAFAIGLALSFAGLRWLASFCWVIVPFVLVGAGIAERRALAKR
jgi:uncharacterized membrane protein